MKLRKSECSCSWCEPTGQIIYIFLNSVKRFFNPLITEKTNKVLKTGSEEIPESRREYRKLGKWK